MFRGFVWGALGLVWDALEFAWGALGSFGLRGACSGELCVYFGGALGLVWGALGLVWGALEPTGSPNDSDHRPNMPNMGP